MVIILEAIVVCGLVVRVKIYIIPKLKKSDTIGLRFDKSTWPRYLAGFFSSVLFANTVPHIFH